MVVVASRSHVGLLEAGFFKNRLGTALDFTAAGHRRDPAAFAHKHAAKVSGQNGRGRNGLVDVFHHLPIVDQVKQRPVGVLAGKCGKLTGARMNDFDGAASLDANRVLNHIGRVSQKARQGSHPKAIAKRPGHHARRGIHVVGLVVRMPSGRPYPQIPIQSLGHGFRRKRKFHRHIGLAACLGIHYLGIRSETIATDPAGQLRIENEHRFDAAQAPVAHELANLSDLRPRPVLGSCLKDTSVTLHRLDHTPPLVDRY